MASSSSSVSPNPRRPLHAHAFSGPLIAPIPEQLDGVTADYLSLVLKANNVISPGCLHLLSD
jgi:hypothetical protein